MVIVWCWMMTKPQVAPMRPRVNKDAAYYWSHAVRAQKMAERAHYAGLKHQWLLIARGYTELARAAEAADTRGIIPSPVFNGRR
jgi:hypothetical protein